MNTKADDLATLAAQHQALIGNTGLLDMSSGTYGVVGPPGPNVEVKRPWIDPPEGHISYDEQNGLALPAAGTGFSTVTSYQVDIGYDGVINFISCNFSGGGFIQFSGDIVWQLRVNGRPVRNFSNITSERGTVELLRQISPIRIYSGQLVEWVVNHVANVALNGATICSINGYVYPNRGT